MKPKNLKEAKELVRRYREITPEEINGVFDEYLYNDYPIWSTANKLTGFGTPETCTLCGVVGNNADNKPNCHDCIYSYKFPVNRANKLFYCLRGVYKTTYDYIYFAKTPEQLLEAFRKRADVLEKLINKIEKGAKKMITLELECCNCGEYFEEESIYEHREEMPTEYCYDCVCPHCGEEPEHNITEIYD